MNNWVKQNNLYIKHLFNKGNYAFYAIDDGNEITLAKRYDDTHKLVCFDTLIDSQFYKYMQKLMEKEIEQGVKHDYFGLEYAQNIFYSLFGYTPKSVDGWLVYDKMRQTRWEKHIGYTWNKKNKEKNYCYSVVECMIMNGVYERCMERIRKNIESIYDNTRKAQHKYEKCLEIIKDDTLRDSMLKQE